MTTAESPATWPGTLEDRELLRAQKIGEAFMVELRAGKHTQTKEGSGWLAIFKERTRLRDRWIWYPTGLKDQTADVETFRAESAGTIMLATFADGTNSHIASHFFDLAAPQRDYTEGWLFDPECLEYDGWQRMIRTIDGTPPQKLSAWHRPEKG